jgi:hypothetical protein
VRGFVRLSGKPVRLLDQPIRLSVQKSKPAKVQEVLLDEGRGIVVPTEAERELQTAFSSQTSLRRREP